MRSGAWLMSGRSELDERNWLSFRACAQSIFHPCGVAKFENP
jgi:hypothetical protein